MKKIAFTVLTVFGCLLLTNAQSISDNAIGLRLGDSDGLGAEISYQRALGDNNRLELDLGWRTGNNFDGFKLVGLYQWVWHIDGGFNWYAGAGGGFIDLYGYPYCRGRIFNDLEVDTHQFNDVADIFWASGACFFIRANVYHQLNGFDEDYFAHQEEIDLCWRTQNIGLAVKYVGTSTVYHVGGATLQETNPHKTFLNFRNSLLNVVKNVPKKWFLFVIFSRLLLDGIAGIKFLIELRPIHTFAILKAHFSFYKNFFKFLRKRKKLQKKLNYNLHTSVVWQYFVMKRKKYEQLK